MLGLSLSSMEVLEIISSASEYSLQSISGRHGLLLENTLVLGKTWKQKAGDQNTNHISLYSNSGK